MTNTTVGNGGIKRIDFRNTTTASIIDRVGSQ
jgi:hypothetical protein